MPADRLAVALRARLRYPRQHRARLRAGWAARHGRSRLVIERASGSLQIVETTGRISLCRVEGLGDLSHASVVYRPDQRFAHGFTSRSRRDVRMSLIKPFERPLDATVLTRIASLRPGQYTRLGAAIRFAAEVFAERAERQRLLFVLTDGKPNDVDHYEGRYGIEDTRRAVLEARRNGLAVFAVTVDDRARDHLPYGFGRGGYALVRQVNQLPPALPAIYRQLTT